jgi:dihydrolipoamide dehydrogenase
MADLLVIGGGPAGVAAALTGARLGARVTLVERSELGGASVHRGEVPLARLRRVADLLDELERGEGLGAGGGLVAIDWGRMREEAAAAAATAAQLTRAALERAGVEVVAACARFVGPGRVEVAGLVFERTPVVLATGASPVVPQRRGTPRPGRRAMTGEAVLAMTELPSRVLVAGGAYLGLGWASLLNRLGSKVAVATAGDRILPDEDREMARALQRALERRGISFGFGRGALEQAEAELEPELLLFADTRLPNYSGLDLEAAGVAIGPAGEVTVDARCTTSAPEVFAAGDLTGPPWFSSRARAQGTVAATCALGGTARFRPERIPRWVGTHPELAAVGLTEEQAIACGRPVTIGRGGMAPEPSASRSGQDPTALKLVVDAEYGEILGAHMVGCGASELIGLVATAMELEADYRDLARLHHLPSGPARLLTEAIASIC